MHAGAVWFASVLQNAIRSEQGYEPSYPNDPDVPIFEINLQKEAKGQEFAIHCSVLNWHEDNGTEEVDDEKNHTP